MEISREYSLAYVEVLTILKSINEFYFYKIPTEKITLYEKYKDKNYIFHYDKSQSIENQVRKETKAVLAYLFLKYIANENDKKNIFQKKRKDLWELEEQKKEIKLNPLFKNKKTIIQKDNHPNTQLIKVEKKNIFMKIIIKIKIFLKGKNL